MPTRKHGHKPLTPITNVDPHSSVNEMASGVDEMTQYNEEQRDEFLALQSIYQDSFEKIDGKAAAWQKHSNLAYSLHLAVPTDVDVFVDLEIELPKDYPKVEPIIKITGFQSPNSALSSQVARLVQRYQKENLGRVFIYDLADAILQILGDDVSVRAGRKPVAALDQERMAQQEAQIREEEQQMQQLHHVSDQDADMIDLPNDEKPISRPSKVVARRSRRGESFDLPLNTDNRPGLISFSQNMTTSDVITKRDFTFNQVSGTTTLLKRKDKTVTIVTPVAEKGVAVPQFVLKDIRLPEQPSETPQLQDTMREVEDLLEETKGYRHANIVDVIGYSVRRIPISEGHGSNLSAFWDLAILTEYSRKGSLKEHLEISGALSADMVRSWTHQLLEALEFFDKHAYVHPAVHEGNILIFLAPRGDVTIKLSDGYGTALRKLVNKAKLSSSINQEHPFWEAPELTRSNQARTNKTCVWDLAVVMLKMASGLVATDHYTSPLDCIQSSVFVTSFNELLLAMFEAEPARRPKAFDLQNFGFFRDKTASIFNTKSSSIPMTPSRRGRQSSSQVLNSASRYETDWEGEVKIGSGGQAKVFKARYLLDGQFYAVKKLVCSSRKELNELVAEIKVLARINHPLIVRYFNAWDEKEYSNIDEAEDPSGNFGDEVDFDPDDDIFGVSGVPASGYDYSNIVENIGIQFGNEKSEGAEPGIETIEREFRMKKAAQEAAGGRWSFGTDEDNDLAEGTDAESSSRSLGRYQSSREIEPEKITLYIQMELCENRSLRSRLKDLTNDYDEGWRMFRQILEALEHVHKSGIVHRDLKPDNIFLDALNNIRIGDFGLATTGQISKPGASRIELQNLSSRESYSIGTPMYIAPEVRSNGAGQYNSKTDMFSLGIIFFEMCYNMPTFSERLQRLKELAMPFVLLPDKFRDRKWSTQGSIIQRLVEVMQDARPSATELLEGGLIPHHVRDQELQQYLNTMLDRDPGAYAKVISKYFTAPVPKFKDLGWVSKAEDIPLLSDKALSVFVRSSLEGVFRRHGAVRTNRQSVFPKSEIYSGAATFLDKSGIAVQLPYDLTLPFARSIAHKKPNYQKSYAIGSTFRAALEPSDPIRRTEACFDYVSDTNTSDLGVKEAETIKVLDECVGAFQELRSRSMSIYLNHGDLLSTILTFCRIKPELHADVIRVLSQLNVGKFGWQDIHAQLRSRAINIMETSLNTLMRFNFQDDLNGTTTRLAKIFEGDPRLARIAHIMSRLTKVTSSLELLKPQCEVYISPLSNNSEPLYRGFLMMQCVDKSTRSVLAVGGRYDGLVESFQPTPRRPNVRAVGFRLDVPKLISLIKHELKQQLDSRMLKGVSNEISFPTLPRRCDILVCSFDLGLHRTVCLEIIQELWAHDLNAELTDPVQNLDELLAAYKSETHCRVVLVRPDQHSANGYAIKLRHLAKKDETEVHPMDLVSFLKDEIDEGQEKITAKLKRLASAPEASPAAADANTEVVVLVSHHKSKKTNRHTVIEAAVSKRRELTDSFVTNAPVVAIETTDAVLQSIRNTRVSNPESWRVMIQAAPQQETRYLHELQEQLQDWAAEGKQGAFVFNYRTRGCIFYDLGKNL